VSGPPGTYVPPGTYLPPVYIAPERPRDVTVIVPGGTVIAPGATIVNTSPSYSTVSTEEAVSPAPQPAAAAAPAVQPEPTVVLRTDLQAPAIGASRSEVVRTMGEPYGTLKARGMENLYYNGMVVIIESGRVIQIR
jgi:hypothetical protein